LKNLILSLSLILLVTNNLSSQVVWENNKSNVYPYLERMAQRGIINFDDIIIPISREKIIEALFELKTKETYLNEIEKKELNFFLKEYDTNNEKNQRWRAIKIKSKEIELYGDPLIGIKNTFIKNTSIQEMSNGFQLWGVLGSKKNIAFQVYYRDYTEKGALDKLDRIYNNEKGFIVLGEKSPKSVNYSDLKANISYKFKNGQLSFGQNNILWGIGENSSIVLSDKAPSYPFIRLDYSPLKWLKFNYFNAWLNSNIIDSNNTYHTNTSGVMGDIRYFYLPKFLASHSITIQPTKGLQIAIGESIVYSDRLDIGFLNPINLFKIYDNNRSNYLINAGSNGQYFFQINSRNQLKNTHLYASMFIDEIKISSIFDKLKQRNQFGINIGGSITDFTIRYLTIGSEYTRINPFVYSNLIPAQFYTHYDYNLGDWIGNNADRFIVYAKYSPVPNLKIYSKFQKIRKGGAGTINQQYFAQPQPSFLFDYQKTLSSIIISTTYEWINNLYFIGSFESVVDKTNAENNKYSKFQFGISYGF